MSERPEPNESLKLPIESVKQTPNACVTACIQACLPALGVDFVDLQSELYEYIVSGEDNPTNNPFYFDVNGIMKVLQEKGIFVGVHMSADQEEESSEIYKGSRRELTITPSDYICSVFQQDDFEQYIKSQLKQKRYLLIWLDNPKYSSEGYDRNHYEQHVVVVYGYDQARSEALIMDPDDTLEEGKNISKASFLHLYNSLWRRNNQPWAKEKIVVIGENNEVI